jgi:hypothetical protein
MAEQPVEAFLISNPFEERPIWIADQLLKRGVSVFAWRPGTTEADAFRWNKALYEARSVVVLLGDRGWDDDQQAIADKARGLNARMMLALVGTSEKLPVEEGELFKAGPVMDFRGQQGAAVDGVMAWIRQVKPQDKSSHQPMPQPTPEFDGIINTIHKGPDSRRAEIVDQIRDWQELDRPALSRRLRDEIEGKDLPGSIRSWLVSSLISVDAEDDENRAVILKHLSFQSEPEVNVRFWALSQVAVARVSYLKDCVPIAVRDPSLDVAMLGRALDQPNEAEDLFRSYLHSSDRNVTWACLRVLRVLPLTGLVDDMIFQLTAPWPNGKPLTYDALSALSNPSIAKVAAPLLASNMDTTMQCVLGVLAETEPGNTSAAERFTEILALLPPAEVDRGLNEAGKLEIAGTVRRLLAERREGDDGGNVGVAGYTSDTIDVKHDSLDIREDVYTLAAVMLAKEVTPPLAIGLFGDWGSGKSFFMESMEAATEDLAKSGKSGFCTDVVSIRFNAWHYAETNLWASLVSHILEQLAAHVNPQLTPEEQQAELMKQLATAQTLQAEAQKERDRIEGLLHDRAKELQDAKTAREKKEVTLRDLKATDLRRLIESDPGLKDSIDKALHEMGIPAVLDSVTDLTNVIAEAGSIRGRIASLGAAVLQGRNRPVTIMLLAALLAIPAIALAIDSSVAQHFVVRVGGALTEVTALVVSAWKVLNDALKKVKENLNRMETAKHQVDDLLAANRAQVTGQEQLLEKEIAELKAVEKQNEARVSAAAAQVVELEKRVQSAQQGLMTFLSERAGSDDYRKHLGLISTIRRDFNSLGKHLAAASKGTRSREVERIVLYIDDLDRCPEEKVMEVLQAVHLLLAYPLFVVVVGVDPRWLLHSLRKKYRAFRPRAQREAIEDVWQTTPQNYLEKIFQIPFSLRPMSDAGYRRLVGSLMLPEKATAKVEAPPQTVAASAIAALSTTTPQAAHESKPPQEELAPSAPQPNDIQPVYKQAPREEKKPAAPPPFAIHEDALTIQPWEAAFAEGLFKLLPTPRAVKRFSNAYRILKAPVSIKALSKFEGTTELPGDFRLPMLLLAILIGAPAESAEVFPAMWQAANAGRGAVEILRGLTELIPQASEELRALQENIRPVVANPSFPSSAKLMSYWLPRVARFSFDVGRALELSHAPAAKAANA